MVKAPEVHKFTLTDRNGTPHAYETTAFRPSVGSRLRAQIAAFIAEPIVVAVYDAVRGQDTDVGKVAAAARMALQAMPTDLIPAILDTTFRDGMLMSAEGAFDDAYSRNYAELDSALWEVVKFNDFLSFPGISLSNLKLPEMPISGSNGEHSRPPA